MRATLLHVSDLHGGSCVLCSDAAAFLQGRTRDEIGAAFLSSPTLQLRLFWREFSILPDHVQEKILNIALLSLAAEAGRIVWREELSQFATSASEGAVIGVAASKLADGEGAGQEETSEDAPPQVVGQPDIFKFVSIGMGLCVGGVFLIGSHRDGFISEGVFEFLALCGCIIAAAAIWRFVSLCWRAGARSPLDFLTMALRAGIYMPNVSAAIRSQHAAVVVGGETGDLEATGVETAAGTRSLESTPDEVFLRAAGALGGVVLGILLLRAEEWGSEKSLAVTELAAEQYLSGATPDEIAWDIMPVELDERINVLSGMSAGILSCFDEEMFCELLRLVKEDGAYREDFFKTFHALLAEMR
jgi:hypothetical protein